MSEYEEADYQEIHAVTALILHLWQRCGNTGIALQTDALACPC